MITIIKQFLILGLISFVFVACKYTDKDKISGFSELKVNYDKRKSIEQPVIYAWLQDHLLNAYESHGDKNIKWDDDVRKLLKYVAHMRSLELSEPPKALLDQIMLIERKGCMDPLFLYIVSRYDMFRSDYPRAIQSKIDVYEVLKASSYGPLEKYYAACRAATFSRKVGIDSKHKSHLYYYNEAIACFQQAVSEPNMIAWDLDMGLRHLVNMIDQLEDREFMNYTYKAVVPALIKRWPNDPDVLRALGYFHLRLGWSARGGEYADKVSDESWSVFTQELNTAALILEKSWAIAPDGMTAAYMTEVELGQGKGRNRLELWFSRAMILKPDNITACEVKLTYLRPRWYGTHQEMMDFGKECVQKKWTGLVPMIMVHTINAIGLDLPKDERPVFYQNSENWKLMKEGFNKFSSINGADPEIDSQYIRYASRAHAWTDLLSKANGLMVMDFSYYGGQANFESLIQEAMENQN
jgi:tetratricopeptide (TPR) repeat protein